jgi:copper oxidase (laccase) domain-containing protein
LIAAGPSIGSCCYEVGADVRDAFTSSGFGDSAIDRWFAPNRPGHWMFDGWTSVREQLIEAGVPDGQIFLSRMCTSCHAAAWPSFRRDGAAAGRIAAAIRIRQRATDPTSPSATPDARRP